MTATPRFEPIVYPCYAPLWAVWDHKRGKLVKINRMVAYYCERSQAQQASDVWNK